jgi:uncharacterized membrane protein
VLVGPFAPPTLASVAVGAAVGGLVGRFANHQLSAGIQRLLGDAMPPGSAAVIGIFAKPNRKTLGVRQAAERTVATEAINMVERARPDSLMLPLG